MKKSTLPLSAALLSGISIFVSSCASREHNVAAAPAVANYCLAPIRDQKALLNEDLDKLPLADLTALADSGNADALVLLGLRYTPIPSRVAVSANAEPRPPVDLERAVSLFRAAADKEQNHGQFLLGVAYMNGMGVGKDEAQAASWFARGAAQGNAAAQFWLGEMKAKGRGGFVADWKLALPYFKDAAAGNATDALLELGYMYSKGFGDLSQDYEKAADCYRRSMKLGSQIARFNLGMLIADGNIKPREDDPKPKVSADAAKAATN